MTDPWITILDWTKEPTPPDKVVISTNVATLPPNRETSASAVRFTRLRNLHAMIGHIQISQRYQAVAAVV